jgi:hypothetical protein
VLLLGSVIQSRESILIQVPFCRHNVDEGRIFVTQNMNSTVSSYIKSTFPNLSSQNATAVANAYQVFASNNATEADNTYKLQTLIFGESEFVCPSLWLVDAFPKKGYQVSTRSILI